MAWRALLACLLLLLAACSAQTDYSFTFSNLQGFQLAVAGDVIANGDQVVAASCNFTLNSTRAWVFTADGFILSFSNQSLALDVTNSVASEGNSVALRAYKGTSDPTNANQKWQNIGGIFYSLLDDGDWALSFNASNSAIISKISNVTVTFGSLYCDSLCNYQSSLKHWWHFEDYTDVYGTTAVSTGTHNPTFVPGVCGKAIRMTKVDNSSVTMGTLPSMTYIGDFTVSFWAYVNGDGNQAALINQRNICGGPNFWDIRWDSSGNLEIFLNNTSTDFRFSLAMNLYQHIVFGRQGTTYTVWVNGVIAASVTNSFTGSFPAPLQINNDPCVGVETEIATEVRVDELMMFSTWVPPQLLYHNPCGCTSPCVGYSGQLAHWWRFEDYNDVYGTTAVPHETGASPSFVPGVCGNALRMTAADASYVVMNPMSSTTYAGDFTVSFWTYINATVPSATIIGQRTICNGQVFWDMRLEHASPTVEYWLNDTIDFEVTFARESNQYYHLALARQGSNYSAWVNGVITSSQIVPLIVPFSLPLQINNDPCVGVDGTVRMAELRMDELMIFSEFVPPSILYANPCNCVTGVNPCTPYAGTLQHWWQFENSYTDTKGTTATPNGTHNPTFVPGVCGNAVQTTAADASWINIPGPLPNVDFSGDFTVSFWVKINGTSGQWAVMNQRTICGGQHMWDVRAKVSSIFTEYFITQQEIVQGAYTQNQFTHIAFARRGHSLEFHVNGVLAQAITSTQNGAITNNLQLNNDPCIGSDGTIRPTTTIFDELKIFNAYIPPSILYKTPCGCFS